MFCLIFRLRIHVRQHRYGLQIVKCLDSKCCKPFQTNWRKIFPKGFLPPPAIYKFGTSGLEVVEPSVYFADQQKFANQTKYRFATLQERLIANLESTEAGEWKDGNKRPPPFDAYCPSMEKKLDDSICKICAIQWPCPAALKRHSTVHGKKDSKQSDFFAYHEVNDEFDTDDETMQQDNPMVEESMPVFGNIKEHLLSPFEQLRDEFVETDM